MMRVGCVPSSPSSRRFCGSIPEVLCETEVPFVSSETMHAVDKDLMVMKVAELKEELDLPGGA